MLPPIISCTWQADCDLHVCAVLTNTGPLHTGCSLGMQCTIAVGVNGWLCSPCAEYDCPMVFHGCAVSLLFFPRWLGLAHAWPLSNCLFFDLAVIKWVRRVLVRLFSQCMGILINLAKLQ